MPIPGISCIGVAGGIPEPPTIAYVTSSQSSSNLTTYTFSSISIGAEATDRLVVAFMTNSNGGSTAVRTLSSCTIGGSAATIPSGGTAGQGVAAGASVAWGVAYRVVPTGTVTDVVFNLSGAPSNCHCHIFTVRKYRSTTPTLYTDTSRTLDFAISGFHPSGAAAGVGIENTSTRTYTVTSTGLYTPTKDVQANIESSTGTYVGFRVSNVSDQPTITAASSSSTSNEAGVVCVWE